METVRAPDVIRAWKAGVSSICDNGGEILNLVTEIESPSPVDEAAAFALDPHLHFGKYDSIKAVVRTIFPTERFSRDQDRNEFYRYSLSLIGRARRAGAIRSPWREVYFERLVRFGGEKTNSKALSRKSTLGISMRGLRLHFI